ncbi:MAG: hypothetical protein U5K32_12925 [Bacteroidales bacterium]|nr:hypothetical protein [Bacteroidales bacterium]
MRSESYLKDPSLSDHNREKLNIWINYLKQKGKEEWNQPSVALYCVYNGPGITNKNWAEIAERFDVTSSPQLVKEYRKYLLKKKIVVLVI